MSATSNDNGGIQYGKRTLVSFIRGHFQQLLPRFRPKPSSSPTSSPAKKSAAQARLQSEIENFVQRILALYVASWANGVSETQTLDKEVQNDLRRVLTDLVDRVRNVDPVLFLLDVLAVARIHLRRLRSSDFQPAHPALSAKAEIGKDEYVFLVTELLLKRHGVHRTISTEVMFFTLNEILARQIFLNLIGSVSEPEFAKAVVFPAKTLPQSPDSDAKRELKLELDSELDTREDGGRKTKFDRKWHSEDDGGRNHQTTLVGLDVSRTLSTGRTKVLASLPPNSTSFRQRKKTLDLTGYSGANTAEPNMFPIKENQASGKISMALGT